MGSLLLFAILALASEDEANYGRSVSDAVDIAECRKPSDADEILVCGQRLRNRYAVSVPAAPFDPSGDIASVMRERSSWIQEGDDGTLSCSAIGPGGWTGCIVQRSKRQREQHAWKPARDW